MIIEIQIGGRQTEITVTIFVQPDNRTVRATDIDVIDIIQLKGAFRIDDNIVDSDKDFTENLHKVLLIRLIGRF